MRSKTAFFGDTLRYGGISSDYLKNYILGFFADTATF